MDDVRETGRQPAEQHAHADAEGGQRGGFVAAPPVQAEKDRRHEADGEQAAGEDRQLDDAAGRIQRDQRRQEGEPDDAGPRPADDAGCGAAPVARDVARCHG